jgi:glycyl-tRNA synthetase beta chain
MRGDLFFEIGTEEIPAGFLARALAELPALAAARLAAARLEHEEITALGAPRRLALHVRGLADRQPDVSEILTGPPASAAFDKQGQPTKAALGFAAKAGVPVSELKVVELPGKGAYVTAPRAEKGAETRALLPGLLAELFRAIPWKKSMRWADLDEAFVRPVHWIVALYAGEVVPLTIYGVSSGRESRGHRFLAPGPIALDGSLDDYATRLRQAFVLCDPAARRTEIEAELARAQRDAGVRVRPDDDLLAEVVNLVEYPKAVVGSFDEAFLAIPPEVIISAMRGHQRYFATETAGGALANRFVTIAGTLTKDAEVVRHGNERVLAARLSDARFFWEEDRATSADTLAGKLGGLLFQKALGTVAEKAARVADLAPVLAATGVAEDSLRQAARLAKLDLVTKMVGEFPDLQGVMGRYYAPAWGADAEVAEAVLEHYLPRGATDRLPPSALGAALGVADRLDTIVGCWAVGLAPTGSADAFGLRRAALAVLNILIDRRWSLSLSALVAAAARLQKVAVPAAAPAEILDFFRTRLRGLLVDGRGLPADCVDAALAAGTDNVPDAVARAVAVAHLRDRADFEPLAVAFKRVANIIKGGAAVGTLTELAADVHASEKALWDTFVSVREVAARHVAAGEYDAALRELAGLKPAVDRFFDDVLVMDPDAAVRQRRLGLLGTVNATFLSIADFKQLAVK